jgi:hypothetical protein
MTGTVNWTVPGPRWNAVLLLAWHGMVCASVSKVELEGVDTAAVLIVDDDEGVKECQSSTSFSHWDLTWQASVDRCTGVLPRQPTSRVPRRTARFPAPLDGVVPLPGHVRRLARFPCSRRPRVDRRPGESAARGALYERKIRQTATLRACACVGRRRHRGLLHRAAADRQDGRRRHTVDHGATWIHRPLGTECWSTARLVLCRDGLQANEATAGYRHGDTSRIDHWPRPVVRRAALHRTLFRSAGHNQPEA